MNIEAKDVNEVKDFLKSRYDESARWVVYQKDRVALVDKSDLHVFSSCNDAQGFCDKSSSVYYPYQYVSLEKLLDALIEKNR